MQNFITELSLKFPPLQPLNVTICFQAKLIHFYLKKILQANKFYAFDCFDKVVHISFYLEETVFLIIVNKSASSSNWFTFRGWYRITKLSSRRQLQLQLNWNSLKIMIGPTKPHPTPQLQKGGILVSRILDISAGKSGHFQIVATYLSIFEIKRL